MQGWRPRRPGRCPGLARAWGGTSPRSPLRGSLAYPWPRVVGAVVVGPTLAAGAARGTCPASWRGWRCPPRPRSAPRRPRPAGRRAVTSFRHAPCLAAPGVPLRCVVGGATAPGRGRPSAVVLPRASVLPSRSGLVMPRARGRARGTPSPPLAPSDSAPGWTPGLARCGAGPRRLCSPRWGGAALPPSAGGRSAGVRAERPDARRRSCAGRPLPLLRICLPPPLCCRLRLVPSAVGPSSSSGLAVMLLALLSSIRCLLSGLRPSAHRLPATGGAVGRRLPAAPASGGSESESGRASSPFFLVPYVCRRVVGCGPDTP